MKFIKKLLLMVSPSFRVISGNKQRLVALLKNIEYLQNQISEMRKGYFFVQPNNININLFGEKVFISKQNKSTTKRYKCTNEEFFKQLRKNILQTDIVLDIGCGVRPQTFFEPKVHICIEPFKQYRDIVKPLFPNRSHFIFLKDSALPSIQTLDDNSVDTVFMVDLIEHLEKKDGLTLLKEADRVARKQIIVFTPLGFYQMHFKEEGQKDAWGLNGNDLQEHKSGWLPEDFGGGWDFHICEDCHEAFLPEEKAAGKKYSALMAIKTKRFSGFDVMEETPQFVNDVYMERVVNGKTD